MPVSITYPRRHGAPTKIAGLPDALAKHPTPPAGIYSMGAPAKGFRRPRGAVTGGASGTLKDAMIMRPVYDVLRPLTAHEEIYWRLTYNDQIHVVFAAEVEGLVSEASWHEAVVGLKSLNPTLACAVAMPKEDNDLAQPVFTFDGNTSIPLRIVDPERFVLEREIEAELAQPFVENQAPLCRVALSRADDSASVLVSVSHSVGDGTTGLNLIRDLLRRAGGIEASAAPAAETAQALLGVDVVPPARRVIDMGPTRSKNAGRLPSVALRRLGREETNAIVVGSRARSNTVHGALTAACVTALRRCSEAHSEQDIKVISPIDTRKLLGLAVDAPGLYFASPQTAYAAADTGSFWSMAETTRRDIAAASSREALRDATTGMQASTQAGLTNAAANEALDGVFAMDFLLTNLGRVPFDANFGRVRVKRLFGPIVLGGRDHVQTIGVTTIDGAMHLAHVSRAPVPGLLPAIVDVLMEKGGHRS